MPAQTQLPPTPKKPVVDVYHGVSVTDNYRWLENAKNPEVKAWAAAETAIARKFLDSLPSRAAILDELHAWDKKREITYGGFESRPGVIIAIKSDPAKQHPVLVAFRSLDDLASERVLVDPDQIDPSHTTNFDFFVPSTDGRYLAVSLSAGGSESGDVHIYETATGKALKDLIPRVNGGTAGGSLAWNADSSGFFYTRYPRGSERPAADMDFYQQVWFHRLGTATDADTYAIGKEFPRIAEVVLSSSQDGHSMAATVENGDGGEYEQWLLTPGQPWRKLAGYADSITQLAFGFDNDAFLLSKENAPRGKILRLHLNQSLKEAQTVDAQSDVVIEEFFPSPAGLCVAEMAGGPSRLRFMSSDGSHSRDVSLPPVSSVYGVSRLEDGELLIALGGYLTPFGYYRFDPNSNALTATRFHSTSPVATDPYEVVRDFAVSKDGTKIPINIIRKKGLVLDGSHPALLTGYGGFDIARRPSFSANRFLLLERGFVFAEANLRGGSEYGEEWHDAGRLTRKQNVFDDFAACAHYLIDHKYTNASKLGIQGGSNGGLLMGAELTQHPNLYRAVVSGVGIYDMLRNELTPNGAFNITEYGTVKEADQFRALYAYSPYHHVQPDKTYPAVLFLTGDNDPRVDPMNSRKMTAALQATATKHPVLLHTSGTSGHGASSKDESFADTADADAFLIHELGAE
jgi:prolyl oligopeptidase